MLFICYPKCSTCKKAEQYLQAKGLSFTVRDIKTDNPTAQLRTWYAASGLPLKRCFNSAVICISSSELKDKLPTMSKDKQLELLASDGMLVKRPLVIYDGGVLVGFKQAEYDEALIY